MQLFFFSVFRRTLDRAHVPSSCLNKCTVTNIFSRACYYFFLLCQFLTFYIIKSNRLWDQLTRFDTSTTVFYKVLC